VDVDMYRPHRVSFPLLTILVVIDSDIIMTRRSECEVELSALEPGLDFFCGCAFFGGFEEGCGWCGVGCVY